MTQRLVHDLPWADIQGNLWADGFSRTGVVLTPEECEELRSAYADAGLFRSRIDMARDRFGQGEYQYFKYPLPEVVSELRADVYEQLHGTATEWMAAVREQGEYPASYERFLQLCHAKGQARPTPLLLRYHAGDYNCLHQDVYGAVVFPFQLVVSLSKPEQEFTGGEFLLVEQRPRAQSVGHALRLGQGEGVVITTRHRPVKGNRGYYRAAVRHGVSRILSGERFTLGVIVHDGA